MIPLSGIVRTLRRWPSGTVKELSRLSRSRSKLVTARRVSLDLPLPEGWLTLPGAVRIAQPWKLRVHSNQRRKVML